jgi:Flp pilus assembly protein TadD
MLACIGVGLAIEIAWNTAPASLTSTAKADSPVASSLDSVIQQSYLDQPAPEVKTEAKRESTRSKPLPVEPQSLGPVSIATVVPAPTPMPTAVAPSVPTPLPFLANAPVAATASAPFAPKLPEATLQKSQDEQSQAIEMTDQHHEPPKITTATQPEAQAIEAPVPKTRTHRKSSRSPVAKNIELPAPQTIVVAAAPPVTLASSMPSGPAANGPELSAPDAPNLQAVSPQVPADKEDQPAPPVRSCPMPGPNLSPLLGPALIALSKPSPVTPVAQVAALPMLIPANGPQTLPTPTVASQPLAQPQPAQQTVTPVALATGDSGHVNAASHTAEQSAKVVQHRQIEFSVSVFKSIPRESDMPGIDFEEVRINVVQLDAAGSASLSAFRSESAGVKIGFYKGSDRILVDSLRKVVDLKMLAHSKFLVRDGQMATVELEKRREGAPDAEENMPPTELTLLPTIQDNLLKVDIRPHLAAIGDANASDSAWIQTMVREGGMIVMSVSREHRVKGVAQIALNLSPKWRGRPIVQPEEWVVLIRPRIAMATVAVAPVGRPLEAKRVPEGLPEPPLDSIIESPRATSKPAKSQSPKSATPDDQVGRHRDENLAKASWSKTGDADQAAKISKQADTNTSQVLRKTQELLDQGAVALEAGDEKRALARFKEAIALAPQRLDLPVTAAAIALHHKEPAIAWEICFPAVEQNPENVELMQALAVTYFELGKPATAQKTLEKAIHLDRSNAVSYKLMGQVLASRGEKGQAAAYFKMSERLQK